MKKGLLTELLNIESNEEFLPISALSSEICESVYGKDVFVRGIIEFSNYCVKDCLYCGLRKSNLSLKRYRMLPAEIFDTVKTAYLNGIKTVVLQSGEDLFWTAEILAELISKIKKNFDIAVTLSIGERNRRNYKILKEAGADRFLLRIETTDKELFKKLHPDGNLKCRIECLNNLKQLGYEVGTGIIVGLPGQSIRSIANDIFFLKEIDADMVGIGPFLPHINTPLNSAPPGNLFLTLKVLALIRIMLKEANIPATTAMGTIDIKGRQKALKIGANVIMPNCTPSKYRPLYMLYNNKICIYENAENCNACIINIAKEAGKKIVSSKGFRANK